MDIMADNIGYRTRKTLMEYMTIATWNVRGDQPKYARNPKCKQKKEH
jgi:hypothetical protein